MSQNLAPNADLSDEALATSERQTLPGFLSELLIQLDIEIAADRVHAVSVISEGTLEYAGRLSPILLIPKVKVVFDSQ
jgi:hypothetical protein